MANFLEEMLSQQKSAREVQEFSGMLTKVAYVKVRDENGQLVDSKLKMAHITLDDGRVLSRYVFPEVFPGECYPVIDKPTKVRCEVIESKWVDNATGEERTGWNITSIQYDLSTLSVGALALMTGKSISVNM